MWTSREETRRQCEDEVDSQSFLHTESEESYRAQHSLELNSPPGPPHHSMQNKELSHPKKKMDIKVDYTLLPPGPASSLSPKFLAQAVYEITTPYNLGEKRAPLRQ